MENKISPLILGKSILYLSVLFICFLCLEVEIGEARDPYNPTGFPPCAGGETGFWQFVSRETPDKKVSVSLVLTTVDVPDPAFVICWVDGKHRVTAVGPEHSL